MNGWLDYLECNIYRLGVVTLIFRFLTTLFFCT